VYNKDISIINVFEGFNFLLVGILFVLVILTTILIYFVKRRISSKSVFSGSIISINETNGENNIVSYHRINDDRSSNDNKVLINNIKNVNQ
jgi:Na+-transporting methylmalonyl-CoA/oxaloacetate decarboxylase gamma subunit